MDNQVIITTRFCGPPDSGNGGYTCGLLSRFVKGEAEVTLLKPPPLERVLDVERADDGTVCLKDGEVVIARAAHKVYDFETPAPPVFSDALGSTPDLGILDSHPFPTCFVCGPMRRKNDGLRIFPGPVKGKNYVATAWIPDPSLGDDDGRIKDEFIWAALDCPGAWAIFADKIRVVVLGKLAVQIKKPVNVMERYIVTGWKISEQGRKITAGTAVFTESGQLCAKAMATWIELA